jgi:hypothetical protein
MMMMALPSSPEKNGQMNNENMCHAHDGHFSSTKFSHHFPHSSLK